MVVTTRMFHKMHEPTISDIDKIDLELQNRTSTRTLDKVIRTSHNRI